MKKLLLSPDPSEGGEKPPSAALVEKSNLSESDASELVRLKREKEDADKKLKEREIRLSELEDENRRLKNPPPPTAKAEKVKSEWLNGIF